jgi:hypothetical protein
LSDAATLQVQIDGIVKELEGLPLEKAGRDRRLTLNAELEAKRKELARLVRRGELTTQLSAIQTELAATTDKQRRRELSKSRAQLEAELADL